jgi:hypothetical protein
MYDGIDWIRIPLPSSLPFAPNRMAFDNPTGFNKFEK